MARGHSDRMTADTTLLEARPRSPAPRRGPRGHEAERRAERTKVWVLALVLACAATAAMPVTPAQAQAGPIGRLLVLVNQDRARSGIGPVALSATLNGIAQAHAQAMAAARRIYQNPAFPGNIPGAMAAGENVGYGPDPDSVSAAFEASPEHQVNIVNPRYAVVGLGVANSPIGLMVVEEFADQAAGGAAPAPAPAPLRAPAPA